MKKDILTDGYYHGIDPRVKKLLANQQEAIESLREEVAKPFARLGDELLVATPEGNKTFILTDLTDRIEKLEKRDRELFDKLTDRWAEPADDKPEKVTLHDIVTNTPEGSAAVDQALERSAERQNEMSRKAKEIARAILDEPLDDKPVDNEVDNKKTQVDDTHWQQMRDSAFVARDNALKNGDFEKVKEIDTALALGELVDIDNADVNSTHRTEEKLEYMEESQTLTKEQMKWIEERVNKDLRNTSATHRTVTLRIPKGMSIVEAIEEAYQDTEIDTDADLQKALDEVQPNE